MADVQTQNALIEAHALARHVRMSPQKARLVMDLIRGQKAQDALQALKYTPKRAAKHIEKVLRSAIANAEREGTVSRAGFEQAMIQQAKMFGEAVEELRQQIREELKPQMSQLVEQIKVMEDSRADFTYLVLERLKAVEDQTRNLVSTQ